MAINQKLKDIECYKVFLFSKKSLREKSRMIQHSCFQKAAPTLPSKLKKLEGNRVNIFINKH